MNNESKNGTSIAIIIGSVIVAGAVVFAALYVGHEINMQPNRFATAMNGDEGDQQSTTAPDEGTSERDASVRQQLLEQLRRQAPQSIHFTDVRNIRVTANEKVMAIDITYAAGSASGAAKATEVLRNVELTADEQGRYTGSFAIGNDKFQVTVY